MADLLAYPATDLRVVIVVLVALAILGSVTVRSPESRFMVSIVAALFVVLAIERGYYWNLFGRGHGPFTLNRITATAAFFVTFIGSAMLQRLQRM